MIIRDSSKHALVYSKHEIRYSVATDGWCGQCIPKANIFQVSNELSSRVGEGEGVAPEKPLE